MKSKLKMRLYNSTKADYLEKIFIGLCILTLVSIIVYIFKGSALSIQSDTSTANLLAKEQIASGKLFPENWYYAQDVWIFALNIPILIMTIFTDNQIMMREISVLIFISIAIISVVLFHKKILRDNAWLISIPLLFGGMSKYYIMQLFGEAAYAPIIFIVYFSLILFFLSINQNFEIINKKIFFLFLAFLIFWGLGTIRYIEVIEIPLLGSICILYYIENSKQYDENIKKNILAPIKICLCIGIAVIIAFILFLHISSKINYIAGQTGASYLSLATDTIQKNFFLLVNSLLYIIGIRENVPILSIQGILNAFRLVVSIFLLIIFPAQQIKKYRSEPFAVKFLLVFTILSVLLNSFLALFTNLYQDMTSIRYYFVCFYLLFTIDAYYIYHYVLKMNILIRVIILCAIIVNCLLSSAQLVSPSIDYNEKWVQKSGIVTFLDSNDLHYGYASYWNAGANTLISNYDVQINAITFDGIGRVLPYRWLSLETWYKPTNYAGKSFLMLTEEESNAYQNGVTYKALGKAEELRYENYVIYVYPYNIAEKAWVQASLDINEEINLLPGMIPSGQALALENQTYVLKQNDMMYGPYINLDKGSYIFTIKAEFDQTLGLQNLQITSDSGKNVLKTVNLETGENVIVINLVKSAQNVEFNIRNEKFSIVNISKETLKRKS